MGTTDRQKKIISILLEFVILTIIYFLSGFFRQYLLFGMYYSYDDTITFYPVSLFFVLLFIFIEYVFGCYEKYAVKNVQKEINKIILGITISLLLTSSLIYLLKLNQFSRLLMFLYVVVSFVLILFKRLLLSKIYIKYSQTKGKINCAVLGNNEDFIESLKQDELYNYVGCISDSNKKSNKYIGTYNDLAAIIKEYEIRTLFILQDSVKHNTLREIVSYCDRGQIDVQIVPEFTDLVSMAGKVNDINGFSTIQLRLFDYSKIMGVNVSVTNMNKTIRIIEDNIDSWKGEYICVANVHTTVTASEDVNYMAIQNGAVLTLPDGGPLSKYSRDNGFYSAKRVTGPDLMETFLKISENKGYSHFFYGSTQETLDKMSENIKKKCPNIKIAGMYSPPFRQLTEQEDLEIINMINKSKADFLWVGLGAPKQEIWMLNHKGKINSLMVGVGAAFDYEANNIKRAPKWMQAHSLEWLYRLFQSPAKLFKRYLVTNIKYLIWLFRN